MDTIDIVISVIVVVAYLFFNYKKKEKKAETASVEIPETVAPHDINFEPKIEKKRSNLTTSMEEIERKSSKMEKYFTYEETNNIETEFYNHNAAFAKANLQNVDNEIEYLTLLTLESDEIVKGIIYGEILKRPNY